LTPIDLLLGKLDGVRQCGAGRWMARCPSHEDRHASLSIRELDNGTVLVNDFAGCGAVDVCAALGLDLAELFPPKPLHSGPVRQSVFKSDVFDLIRAEVGVVWLIGCDMRKRNGISEQDYARLGSAIAKFERVAEAAYGSR
jgi:hypothetical protein